MEALKASLEQADNGGKKKKSSGTKKSSGAKGKKTKAKA
jgi:hypothetical protein